MPPGPGAFPDIVPGGLSPLVSMELAFVQRVIDAEDGEVLVLYDGPWESWYPDMFGARILIGNAFHLNDARQSMSNAESVERHDQRQQQCMAPPHDAHWAGYRPDHDDEYDMWFPHPDGIVASQGSRIVFIVRKPFDPDANLL